MKKICEKCGEDMSECINNGWLHTCKGAIISIKCGDGNLKDQKKFFKNDILQPYHQNGKINDEFIKVYGKSNHPYYNKSINNK